MKKVLIAAALATMVSGAALASDNLNNGAGSLNTNSNNGAITQTHSNNTTIQGGNYEGTVVQQPSTQTQRIITNQVAPVGLSNLTTSGHDTCFGSQTGGVSVAGLSVSSGSTVIDHNCELIKNVKLLNSLGLKDAAVALLIQNNPDIAQAIATANPLIAEKLDPVKAAAAEEARQADAAVAEAKQQEAERIAQLAKYESVGLEPPAHLLVPVEIPSSKPKAAKGELSFEKPEPGSKERWLEVKNGITHKCRYIFNSNITSCTVHNS